LYLNCHTYYSFKYGSMSPEALLKEAQAKGVRKLALTDINSTSGVLDFLRLAPRHGVEPVVGVDFRNGPEQLFVAIASNNKGFKEINDYLSLHLHRQAPFPPEAPPFEHCFVIYPLEKTPARPLREQEFAGVAARQATRLAFSAWKNRLEKVVLLQTATFRHKRDFNAHRLLRAVDNNTLLSKLPKTEEGSPDAVMLHPEAVKSTFSAMPQVIANTERLLAQCHIQFDLGNKNVTHNQRTYTGTEAGDHQLIRQLCNEGLAYRFPDPGREVLARIEKELEVIEQKNFVSYFLINWDIVRYAQQKGYFYVGRGSGANSIVAYLLRITDVDPVELDLYFERFINPYRSSPPDFDVDFSWRDREDVTRYIFKRFSNAALLGSYITFKYRSMVREIGKVLGLPPREIDKLQQPNLQINRLDHIAQLVLKYSRYIADFPSHLSVHASGIIISEKPIHCFSATSLPPKGFPTTHFDMYVAEDVGLHKFDILGQRGLAKIKEALEVIRENRPEAPEIDIHDIRRFKQDETIKGLLREGLTMACFYVESPAMRMLLKKLRVDNYIGLVAASSIIRPGVAQSGMMQEYIKRYRNPAVRKHIHPKLGELINETYGVMVYQEDVLKVAHYFAGLTLAEADILRRGMSWKFRERNEFWKVKEKFFANCKTRGYGDVVTKEVWRQIESFGNYAFAKGHSASYAVESYQSLFLKAHYPLEYLVATLNNFGGFYRTEIYVHEAKMAGGIIESPCVNTGRWETRLRGRHIYLGLQHLKDLEVKVAQALLAERERHGPFRSLPDFIKRVAISLEQLILLIRCGAFRCTGKTKKELLWEAHFLLGDKKKSAPRPQLFDLEPEKHELPELEYEPFEDAFDEIELLGFPVSHTPFDIIGHLLENTITAREFPYWINRTVRVTGYLVHVKNTTTRQRQARHMQFSTFLDREGRFVDTVHFPPVAARYPFRGRGCYLLTGKVIEEYDYLSLEVQRMEKVPLSEVEGAGQAEGG